MKKISILLLALVMLLCACNASTPTTTGANKTGSIDPLCDHADVNGDEWCDGCGGDVTVELDFYAINDLHGVFCDTDEKNGVAKLTTYLKNAYADPAEYEILLASGDMWQGSVESNSNHGALMTEWMNEMGFVSMTIGNHEYDWGSGYISSNAALAEFPFLGINITDKNVTEPYCQSSTVVQRGGVRIGIIGAMGDHLSSISGDFTDGISFASGATLTNMVKAEATRLRQEGCDLIIYSVHDNTGSYDVSLSDGYVDLVFEAHSHSTYAKQDSFGIYHVQSGGYNSGMSFVNICYNLATDSYAVETVQNMKQSQYNGDRLKADSVVEQLFNKYFAGENPYTKVLGTNALRRNSSTILKQVAKLYMEKGQAAWGSQYEIVLAGAYLSCRDPYDLPAGDVTYSQLTSLLPFDNDLVLGSISGKDLKQRFIFSQNNKYYCSFDAGLADRIVDSQRYYIITDTYTSTYAPNNITEVARLDGVYARDLLRDFIAAGGWSK